MKKHKIITVINAVSPTSMPINEFLLFRKDIYDEQGLVITIDPLKTEFKNLFNDLKVLSIKKNPLQIVKYLLNNSSSIIHMHQPKSAFFITLLTIILPKKFNRIITVHNNFDKFKPFTRLIILFNSFFSKKTSFVSKSSYDSFPFINEQKHIAITNGVDIRRVNKFLQKINVGVKKNKQIELIYIGKLHKQKNHFQLIDIFNSLPNNYKLTIVGEGDQRKIIENKIEELELNDRINITGIIAREKVYELLIKSDIFVSTALWEGMPIGVLEAMSCYLPVVLSKINPHLEIQNKSIEKFICENNHEFTQKIIEYSSFTPQKRFKIGSVNREIVEKNFILSTMHKKYDLIYSDIV